ncbi:hypothetical protein AAF712_004330 [Marasmius tenuissimus]|uniref:Uncharacterized protein n=1 Tax=Marasmius tenuissimus TaxID=585030 RepID=A0ABR3A5F3_9AGAR
MEAHLKRKVTSKLSPNDSPSSRPASPVKTLAHSPSISTLRPKAKVNTSATARTAKVKPTVSAKSSPIASTVSTSLPRPASPSKFQRPTASPQPGPQRIRAARSNLGTKISQSVPSTPIMSPVEPSPSPLRPTFGVGNTSPQLSERSGPFHSGPSTERSLLASNRREPSPSPIVRVKSKVSSVAKPAPSESLSPPLGPSFPSSKPGTPRIRAPSITSSLSLNSYNPSNSHTFAPPSPSTKSEVIHYPITTATPAANPHRFATTRASPPPPSHHHYQPFSPPTTRDDSNVNYNANKLPHRPSISARVDPAFVPLPPHSPPASALSFSSRSSVSASRSSVSGETKSSSTTSHHTPQGSSDLKSTLDALVQINGFEENGNALGISYDDDPRDESEQESEEKKVKNAAKSNRKIQDLEISNRSLLAINSMLESTRNRQAKEIRDLRRKLRESRLILPPRTYRIVSSGDKDNIEVEDESDDEDEAELEKSDDQSFMRVRMMIDELVESGKQALASKPEDFMTGRKSGAKVLNEDELKSWRDSAGGSGRDEHERRTSPSRAAIPDDHDIDELDSEDEVSMIILPHSNSNSPSPPPILITRP